MEGWNTTWPDMLNIIIVEAQISRNSEFTREIDHNKRDFSRHW
jgi:hypothetical protein